MLYILYMYKQMNILLFYLYDGIIFISRVVSTGTIVNDDGKEKKSRLISSALGH